MRALFLAVLVAVAGVACGGAAAVAPTPSPSGPAPSPTFSIDPRAPFRDILTLNEVGMPPLGGADHVTLEQAASEQQNQPLALTEYRAWGWVDETTRAWGGDATRADEALLLLTQPEGAGASFRYYSNQLLKPPLAAGACPADLGLDECAEGSSGNQSVLVGRIDRYVMRFQGIGVDLHRLARLQVARIRVP